MDSRISVLTGFVIVAIVIMGCSIQTASNEPSPTVVNVAAFTLPGGGAASPAVLSLYKAALEVNKASKDFELELTSVSPSKLVLDGITEKAQFRSANVTALAEAMGQNPAPDLVLFLGLADYGGALDRELLQPLNTYVQTDKGVPLADYFPGAIEALSRNGQLYALPVSVAPTVMMYDKRVFERAHVGEPDPNWDWSSFLAIARQLTKSAGDAQKDTYAIALDDPMGIPAFVWQNGGDLISNDGKRSTLTDPATVEGIKFYHDLLSVHKVVPPQPKFEQSEQVMMAPPPALSPGEVPPVFWTPGGRVAMTIVQGAGRFSWNFVVPGDPDRPMRLVELPKGKIPATVMDIDHAFAMTAKAANGPVAYKAMVALAHEMQKELAVPARRTLAKNLKQMNPDMADEDIKVILNSLEYARTLPWSHRSNGNEVTQVLFEKLMIPIQRNSKPLDELIKEASDALNIVLSKY